MLMTFQELCRRHGLDENAGRLACMMMERWPSPVPQPAATAVAAVTPPAPRNEPGRLTFALGENVARYAAAIATQLTKLKRPQNIATLMGHTRSRPLVVA